MKKRSMVIAGFCALAAVLFSFPAAYAQKQEFAIVTDQAVILDLAGDVDAKLGPSSAWINAEAGMVVPQGGEIKTGPESWAEIGFEVGIGNENVVRLKENSDFTLVQAKPVRIELLTGTIRTLVQNLPAGSTFEIKTPTAVCGARGTGWDTATDGTKVTVDVYEREVYFYPLSGGGEPVADPIIGRGKSGLLEGPGKPITISDLAAGKMDDWNKWKDDMSKRTGIKVGLEGKINKLNIGGKSIEEAVEDEEERALEKKDRENIEDRLEGRQEGERGTGKLN